MKKKPYKKLKLYGFNNLTKTLIFNIYDICYAKELNDRKTYIDYIDEQYNAERLTKILTDVASIIGANILNIASQDYEPQGASVTMLISEEKILDTPVEEAQAESPGPLPETVLAHLDKSHITVHTYPESHPDDGISTFRVDIDVSTCGRISPLKALNYLIHSFDSDIITIDYRVIYKSMSGKNSCDHKILNTNYISSDIRNLYQMIDVNVYQKIYFNKDVLRF